MSTRPFAYNPSGNISGTQQFGSLTVGTPADGFESTSLKWWNGPEEDLNYIIAQPDPEGLHIGADGDTAYLGFVRSSAKTEASFLLLANKVFDQSFLTGDAAKTWLNDNEYWTSWGLTPNEEAELFNAIITSNNEYISLDEGVYLAYNI